VSGDPITIPCRSRKSPAEIALMQRANDINTVAYQTAISMLHEGMTQPEFAANAAAALKALGIQGGIGAQFGAGTAFPHGSRHPEILREGDVVLMDGVCTLEGYHSDISRVVVFGKPTQRHRDVWELEKAAQAAAFAAAQEAGPADDQTGVVVAVGGKVVSAEVFGSPELLKARWEQIVRSLMFESGLADAADTTTADAEAFLQQLAEAEVVPAPGVGIGEERHLRSDELVAQALVLDDALVHASVFARIG